jgi:hypothetical protein
MDSISDGLKSPKFPSALLFLALFLGVAFAFGLIFTQSSTSAGEGSDIRIINASDVDFVNVVVGGISYGNIERGQSTGYRHWKKAYRYSSASLKVGEKMHAIQPIDYVGEKPLGSGRFAYLLKPKENGELEVRVQGDEG